MTKRLTYKFFRQSAFDHAIGIYNCLQGSLIPEDIQIRYNATHNSQKVPISSLEKYCVVRW